MSLFRKEKPLSFADRLGCGLLASALVILIVMLLTWVPFLLGDGYMGVLFFKLIVIYFAYKWLILIGAFLLGFVSGDKYLFFVTEPFIRLVNWIYARVK